MKAKTRIKIKKRINLLGDRKEKDGIIQKKLLNLAEIKKADRIHCYQSFKDEVSTSYIIERLKNKIILADKKLHLDDLNYINYNINVIIVPGRAFDTEGNRLGRGFGHYDKILRNVNAIKIGLAYESQITKFPTENHDQKVDIIVTENRIIKCSKRF